MMGVFIAFGGTVCIISVFSGVTGRSAVTLADAHGFFFIVTYCTNGIIVA